jgi:rhamnose transport system ATP-binding protein
LDHNASLTETILVEAISISKSCEGVHALRHAGFELRASEVHALIGENGAGKSTLIKIITGALAADSGTLRIAGQPITHNTPALARELGIAAIYQQPSLFPHLTVAENISLPLEGGKMWCKINWPGRMRRARDLLTRAGADIDPNRLVQSLSMPEQQLVEIAKAVGAKARIVIMDEPTASLTDREVDLLFEVIRSLRAEGTGVVYISHRLEEISEIADRVTVLRDGKTIVTRNIADVSKEELIRMMVGRDLSAVYPKRPVPIGEVVLEVCNLGSDAVHDVSVSVRKGEILGIAGLVGSGRTELAQVLFGLASARKGTILLRGVPVRLTTPSDAIRLGIAYVPEDRCRYGVILPFPVTANTSLASLASVSQHGLLNFEAERELTQKYVDRLQVKAASIDTETGFLSGGNQQKVALARWLATNPSVVILDEPTQGVDVGSKSEIHRLMIDLAEQGVAIIMISSELPEILGMSDRIAVMRDGTIAGVLPRDAATAEKILSLALGS